MSLSYCGELIRNHDPDRFLLSLFISPDKREDIWSILAFYYEIAKTRQVVSEKQLGVIRLKWWEDAIREIYSNKIAEHEVIKPLATTIKKYDLEFLHFQNLILSRAQEFQHENFTWPTLEAHIGFEQDINTALHTIITDVENKAGNKDCLQAISLNYALIGMIRNAVFSYQNTQKTTGNAISEDLQGYNISDVIERYCELFVSELKAESRYLKLCQAFSSIWLKKLEKNKAQDNIPSFLHTPKFLALRLFLQFGLKTR